jgi:hypothetical protein
VTPEKVNVIAVQYFSYHEACGQNKHARPQPLHERELAGREGRTHLIERNVRRTAKVSVMLLSSYPAYGHEKYVMKIPT